MSVFEFIISIVNHFGKLGVFWARDMFTCYIENCQATDS